MDIAQFLAHYGLSENPFAAEEARYDPVFDRLATESTRHQDFDKILGDIEKPSSAVVFGERGSGKTAIRLMIGKRVAEHNDKHPDRRTLLVAYDDLNPVLDRIVQRQQRGIGFTRASRSNAEKLLANIRLQDHQDAILSLAVTRVIDGVLGEPTDHAMPQDVDRRVRGLPRHQRVDLAVLAALYDQPRSGAVAMRWGRLRRKLRLSLLPAWPFFRYTNITLSILAALLWIAGGVLSWGEAGPPSWLLPAKWVATFASIGCWAAWGWSRYLVYRLARGVHREVRAVQRDERDLLHMLLQFKGADLAPQPWPVPGVQGEYDSRFQLTAKLLALLESFGYRGIMVLCDRIDEPALVSGKPQCMKSVVWPMFDHKFLQQDRVGIKLLLPIELRDLLHRESTEFFQEARLDKQNLIDRLTWSGATLYDMCTTRLRACGGKAAGGAGDEGVRRDAASGGESGGGTGGEMTLRDLFAAEVTRQNLVEALDQMHQPRDAFKFLYAVMQEHCRIVPQDEPQYEIPRLTLESVRRQQSQRVQDLQRGMAPA